MKKAKRLLALLLALVMCLGVLAGCQQDPADTTPAGTTKPADTSAPAQTTAPIETTLPAELKNVDIYPLDSDKVFDVGIAVTMENFGELDCSTRWEELTGVEINYIPWTSEQLNMAFNTDSLPDAVFYSGMDKAKVNEYGEAGMLVNFMDYLDIMPNFSRALEKYPEALDAIKSKDGAVYSLPRLGTTSTTHDNILIRTDMMNAAGWDDLPATADEFLQCVADIQAHYGANDPEFKAFSAYAKNYLVWDSNVSLIHFFFPSFGDLMRATLTVDADGKIVLGASTEQYKRLMTFLNKLATSDAWAYGKDIYAEDGTNSKALAIDGKNAITTVAFYLNESHFPSGNIDMTVLRPLTSEWQDEVRFDAKSSVLWMLNCISTDCEDIETMVKWFDSFYAQEDDPLNEAGTMWGISYWLGERGVDYTVQKETGNYTVLPHEGYETGPMWMTSNTPGGCLGLFDFLYSQDSNTGLEALGVGTMQNTYPYKVDSFDVNLLALTEDESDAYTDNWTDINSHITDWTASFITGDKNVEADWDEYIKGLENMGLQEVIDAYQAAYDRYLAG